ncbi:metal-dependent hydrolase [Alkanindiges illinoisensis]|uniref:Metal-dependent hydrolase n=1 Tax=Alkanindiges illinoisensis TaxID=197183 RepID=A0A4Y7XDN3_9GAMM|nr:metal-dependent hydrolase [Alkanindiges illinoisensis]TEU28665.1 metal-dependent hydrolase [Alkanindiges illinoisensis]
MTSSNVPANTRGTSSIQVRRQSFDFAATPKYYFDNNPLLSYLLTALSLTFPHGERFFVHSVRNVRDQIKNDTLQKDVSAFIGQEAMHSHAHEDFNRFVEGLGLNIQPILDSEYEKIEYAKSKLNHKQQLAVTCALEHFTAIIAQYLLEHPDFHRQLNPRVAKLWMWHALEETEHKAVAFDVYQEIFADQATRKRIMRIITTTFLSRISYLTFKLLLNDPVGRKQWRQHITAFKQLKDVFTTLVPAYLDYYQDNFHPNQHDSTQITAHWRKQLFDQEISKEVASAAIH